MTSANGVRILEAKAIEPPKNTLVAFITIRLPSGLIIRDLTVHTRDGKAWIAMPGKPETRQDGSPVLKENGKPKYISFIQFATKEIGEIFSSAVLKALREQRPGLVPEPQSEEGQLVAAP